MASAHRCARHHALLVVAAVAASAIAPTAAAPASPHRVNLSHAAGPLGLRSFQLDRSVLGNLQGPQGGAAAGGAARTAISRNFALVAEVSVGTPAQKLRCLVDSGSSDLWVPSRHCQSCETERVFRADASETLKAEMLRSRYTGRRQPRAVRVSYGSGEIIGYSVADTVAFGPTEVKDQSFLIVEDAELPPQRGWDGICGLGWKGLTQLDSPLYERLQEQGVDAIFAFVPGKLGQSPFMTVGSVPEEATMEPGTLVWAKAEASEQLGSVNGERGFWIVKGGIAITRKDPVPARFLVDTGTNQVLLAPTSQYFDFMRSLLPPETFDRLCGRDPRAGNLVVCDCSVGDQADLPPLRIYLGERAFVLPIKDLFREEPASDGGTLCVLQIQPNGMEPSPDIGISGPLLGGLLGPSPLGGGMGGGFPMGVPMGEGGAGTAGDQRSADGALGALLGALFGPGVVVRPAAAAGPPPRRLQYGPVKDPMEDVWMIGGVFLERYVTIFDFDGGRMGFAEPAGGPVSLHPSKLADASLPQDLLAVGSAQRSGGVALFACTACYAALLGIAWRLLRPRAADFGEEQGDEEDDDEGPKGGEMPLLASLVV